MTAGDWREGHRLLAERIARLPAIVRDAARDPDVPLDLDVTGIRRLATTGIGSSEAHARLLAHLVAEHTALPARFLPPSALLVPGPGCAEDALVVFSQGLSPNAQLALAHAARWRCVVAATAVTDAGRLAALRARGVTVVPFAGEGEFGTLVRVIGPLTGSLCVLRLARAFGVVVRVPPDRLAAAVAQAPAAAAGVTWAALAAPLALVASGAYAELVTNLRRKILEGMLRPMPPVWDPLELAHGPFQQAFAAPATFLALTRPDAPEEEPLLARLEAMLEPERHALVRLPASLPMPFSLFEHEMQLNALLLRELESRAVDQVRWPGRGHEQPLYDVSSLPIGRRMAAHVWPEVATLVAGGCRTAVLPLGSTEQHGPHLPLDTDTVIGDALAERLCAEVGDALACPTLPVGCASEHLAFPGTLHLEPATLAAVLRDAIRALGRHGIARVFLFSAHGGNAEPLRAALPELRRACAPVAVDAFTDLGRLTDVLRAVSAACGIPPASAGHHAGETETSMLLALDPARVRNDALAPGLLTTADDPQRLFYPDLRVNAPDGTVGDPRGADAARGARYLRAWTELLAEAYRREKNHIHATGTQNE
jgi:creatinine amidohydrolase/Fe(II)-dependent formamide hydrolase-like protein